MKTCPDCGKAFGDEYGFCPACGTKLVVSVLKSSSSGLKGSLGGKKYNSVPSTSSIKTESDTTMGKLKGSIGGTKYSTTPIATPISSDGDEHAKISGRKLKGIMGGSKNILEEESKHTLSSSSTTSESNKTSFKERGYAKPISGIKSELSSSSHADSSGKSASGKKAGKPLIIAASAAAAILLIILIASGTSDHGTSVNTSPPSYSYTEPQPVIEHDGSQSSVEKQEGNKNSLSASCDYILCAGYDNKGNEYELVANQTESPRGFEIEVGVIKNNSWLFPLSKDFPFLADDGLFHVSVSMAGESGTSLQNPNTVIQNIFFVDSGAFLMDCYKANNSLSIYDHSYIIFSCSTQQSYTVNCSNATLLYRYIAPEFSGGYLQSYGEIFTDNGKLIMYSETSGTSSGWTEDQVFEWSIFNTETLTANVIASNVKGVRPECTLSEGLFMCSDKCFYSLSGQKTIDLSDYSIDLWDNGDIYFNGGTCSFKAKNSLGTTFVVTIDSSGNVLSEVAA